MRVTNTDLREYESRLHELDYRRYVRERDDAILAAAHEGMSLNRIARAVNMSRAHVYRIVSDARA
jgi:AcrR family transcriptional regulator